MNGQLELRIITQPLFTSILGILSPFSFWKFINESC